MLRLKTSLIIGIVVLTVVTAPRLYADSVVIGPFGFGVSHFGDFPAATSAEVQIRIAAPALLDTCTDLSGFPAHDPACLTLFDGTITTANIGQTFTINASNNPQFSSITNLLNNGFSYITIGEDSNGFGEGTGTEDSGIAGLISSVTISVDTVCFSATPNCSGGFNTLIDGTVTANAVPEPSSLILTGIGLFAVSILFHRDRLSRT
jgi:hypothetical protein